VILMAKDEKRSKIQDKLTDAEKRELEAILDRLSVQNPDGDSFSNWLESLKNTFSNRQRFITALLDVISKSPTEAGKRVFLALKDCVRDKELRKIVRTAEYRMTQKGLLQKEKESSQPEKVVVFSDKPLKNIELEAGEAHLWIFPFCGRCSLTLYVPSLTGESRSVVVGSDIREWSRFFIGKTLEPDRTLQVMVEFGGKRVYRELTSIIAPMPGVASVPVSIRFGALLASELIDIFSRHRPTALTSRDLQMAKDLFNSLLPDDVENLWMREGNHIGLPLQGFSEPLSSPLTVTPSDSEGSPQEIPRCSLASLGTPRNDREKAPRLTDHADEVTLNSLAQSVGSFWFVPETMMELSESLFDIVDSVLSWEQAHKEYHIRRRLLDFISSGDRFSLELYRFFLKSSALVMAKRDNKIPEARVLFRIANDLLEAEDLSKWEDFLITHLCSSFANFAGFQKQWEEKRNAPSQPVVSSLVVVPGEEATKKSKWAILEEFLTEMISSGRR